MTWTTPVGNGTTPKNGCRPAGADGVVGPTPSKSQMRASGSRDQRWSHGKVLTRPQCTYTSVYSRPIPNPVAAAHPLNDSVMNAAVVVRDNNRREGIERYLLAAMGCSRVA